MKAALSAIGVLLAMASPGLGQVGGQQLLESYVAVIGAHDLVNSNGQRLTQPWQVIRQDRANYHRFGLRDPGDEGDTFFASAENRALMERLLRQGGILASASGEIMRRGTVIQVDIHGGAGGDSIMVTTLR